jgi:hypothetical protein
MVNIYNSDAANTIAVHDSEFRNLKRCITN